MTEFENFIKNIIDREMPPTPIAKIRTFAKELAEGALLDFWSYKLPRGYITRGDTLEFEDDIDGENINKYLIQRWANNYPTLYYLINLGYLIQFESSYQITKEAFNLVSDVPPSTVFISYKQSESSAFALLILSRLKQGSLEPFLDMALIPGEDWKPGLEERIKARDYFIVLLGKNTLTSSVTVQEIQWAMEYKKIIIPLWHNGFQFNKDEWNNIPDNVKEIISSKHAIRVIEESALSYNTAIVELLNRFGITP